MTGRVWIVLAGISGALAVALGAWGAHGLEGDAVLKGQFNAANRYHFWHSLALVGAALLADRSGAAARRWATASAALFALGLLLFSGSLYAATALGFWGITFLAPWGGFAFMTGWLALSVAAFRQKS
ncbi:MAG: DUF423 domain-containing protein [Rhodospirillales bacterium CG15_BIG_FIL_POST_REV_8_21_14_020_66_15]|nr:MAG: DUF423 domain-containing protein [Rhodospirillales bacterium CG15_BIG_FIL_POST_REV_8_21_14_020_66_15]